MNKSATAYGWISVREASAISKISTDLVYSACAKGALRHVRIGAGRRKIRTTRQWVDEWLAAAATGGPNAPTDELRQSA